MRILLPWSKIEIPGIAAIEIADDMQCIDPIVDVPHSAAAELTAAFAAFCGSWQQGDRHGCTIVSPFLTKYGVTPLPL
jgi:hypothetical protein